MAKRRNKDHRKAPYAPYHLRKRVYERDAGQCQYCGAEVSQAECNIDHVIPRSQRGITVARNLVVACQRCNEMKGRQMIPAGLRPQKGEAFLTRQQTRDGVKTEAQREASSRMHGTISIIREAAAMGVYLDDLFSEATQKEWR